MIKKGKKLKIKFNSEPMLLKITSIALLFSLGLATFPSPNGDLVETENESYVFDYQGICGTANMFYVWGDYSELTPRFSELYFFNNGSFHDNSFSYLGEYIQFGENGDSILTFFYTSARYYAPHFEPSVNVTGSMVSHQTMCGYWYFEDLKWNCIPFC